MPLLVASGVLEAAAADLGPAAAAQAAAGLAACFEQAPFFINFDFCLFLCFFFTDAAGKKKLTHRKQPHRPRTHFLT